MINHYIFFDHQVKQFSVILEYRAYSKEELLEVIKEIDEKNGIVLGSAASLEPEPQLNPDSLEEIEIEIEKPEGFDLRDKRSEKSQKAADWTPADALYDAAREIKQHPAEQLIVVWWQDAGPKGQSLRWRIATSTKAETAYLISVLLNKLTSIY